MPPRGIFSTGFGHQGAPEGIRVKNRHKNALGYFFMENIIVYLETFHFESKHSIFGMLKERFSCKIGIYDTLWLPWELSRYSKWQILLLVSWEFHQQLKTEGRP